MSLYHQNHEHAIVMHDKQPEPLLLHFPNIEPPQPHENQVLKASCITSLVASQATAAIL
jgi:hypothetical protein